MRKLANSNVFLKLNYKECIPEHWPAPASDRSTFNLDKEALVADCIILVHEYIIIASSWYMKILLLHPPGLKYIINASYKFENILLLYPPGKNMLLWHPPGSKWILFHPSDLKSIIIASSSLKFFFVSSCFKVHYYCIISLRSIILHPPDSSIYYYCILHSIKLIIIASSWLKKYSIIESFCLKNKLLSHTPGKNILLLHPPD